jgi:hypothetical protein
MFYYVKYGTGHFILLRFTALSVNLILKLPANYDFCIDWLWNVKLVATEIRKLDHIRSTQYSFLFIVFSNRKTNKHWASVGCLKNTMNKMSNN